ncbi:tetratricopeptide repeat protein [Plantactinospora siamensis]|uniref:Tetratricopeptide repeat protein n=1 Tax=Plantactinospora siamensis TaxID=555372 RepID=A0ABV6P358_9ACTN
MTQWTSTEAALASTDQPSTSAHVDRPAVTVRLLGPVEVRADGGAVALGPAKQKALLAALAIDVGHPVPVRTVMERLWDDPPAGARSSLYSYVARLRQVLRGITGRGAPLDIATGSGGYMLRASPQAVDLARYTASIARARQTTHPAERAELFSQAIEVWGGEPLADVAGAWAANLRAALTEQQVGVMTDWAESELACGRPDSVVNRLPIFLERHPLVEPLLAAFLQALAMQGRSAEALDRYARYRERLIEELGADPGPRLAQIHAAILRNEVPTRQWPGERPPATAEATTRPDPPRQLPLDIAALIGREREVAAVSAALDPSTEEAGRACCISGTAGVGKTALAVHCAHRMSQQFPDGQLYLDLRGFGPDRPLDAAEALEILLRAVGVPSAPYTLAERINAYRSAMADRRVLVLLDNAAASEQVRPLLAAGPGCATLITSRDKLAALVARDSATRVDLAPLPAEAAVRLLERLLGQRASVDRHTLLALAQRCSFLPLALRVATEAVRSRPRTPLAALMAEADGGPGWLDLLDTGDDDSTAVRGVLSWSYRSLAEDAARAFRLLGSHPGQQFGEAAAMALLGEDIRTTRRLLRDLLRANLIMEVGQSRFVMHDLLRQYAREFPQDRPAIIRMLDHYLITASAAMRTIRPMDLHDLAAPPSDAPAPFTRAEEAMRWLRMERANLLAAIERAAASGHPHHVVRLASTIRRFLELRGSYTDMARVHHLALDAARELGDVRAEALTLRNIGVMYGRVNETELALQHFTRSLELFRAVGDRVGEASVLGNLGILFMNMSRVAAAESHLRQAIALCLEIDVPLLLGTSLTALGALYAGLGRYDEAIEHHARAIAGLLHIGNWQAAAAAQDGLGATYRRLGRYDEAWHCFDQALRAARASGHRYGECAVLINLGELYRLTGCDERAVWCFRQATQIARSIDDRRCEAGALNGLARVLLADGRMGEATVLLRRALLAARSAEDSTQQVRALTGLGLSHRDERQVAHRFLDQAWSACTPLETTEAQEIRAIRIEIDDFLSVTGA